MYKLKLQIGEFSKLCGVTVKTLRHYEKMGLIRPMEVDKWTGYRYYQVSQLQTMETIRGLKAVGFSLEEIGDLIESDCQTPGQDLLLAKIRETEAQLHKLVLRRDMLLEMADSQNKYQKMEQISIQTLPSITVASYRGIIEKYDKLGDLCLNVIGPEMARLGCECPMPGYCFTIEHNKEYQDHDIDIEYCEMVREAKQDSDIIKFKVLPMVPMAVCFKCYGPYDRLYRHYVDAFAYIAKEGYEVVDAPRANYVDGIWNQADPEKWLTVIQIPVRKIKQEPLTTSNRLKLYCCPTCGAVTIGYGKTAISCCGEVLPPVPCKKVEQADRPTVAEMDGEFFLEYNHPMTKDSYIAAVVVERYDRVELIRLFPEQEASVRVPQIKGAKIYTLYRQMDKVWATVM